MFKTPRSASQFLAAACAHAALLLLQPACDQDRPESLDARTQDGDAAKDDAAKGGATGDGGFPDFLGTGGSTGPTCRGLLCPRNQYCVLPEGTPCGETAMGSCQAPQRLCFPISIPVCGCDGRTYDNRCFASMAAATNVASMGACGGPPPQPCGSRGLARCPDGQFCHWEPRDNCGEADAPGVCAPIPTLCPTDQAPVCGCDKKQYDNECFAAQLGVSARWLGSCDLL